ALENTSFNPKLVSHSENIGVIHKKIIENLYKNPVVICDVSGKNPNVMFELGLRLAFDKPTIIIKDYETDYSFDTSPIKHLEYPRDLNYSKMKQFQKELIEAVKATYEEPNDSTFLKSFGTFKAVKIDTETIPEYDFILEKIESLTKTIENTQYNNIYEKDIYGNNFYSRGTQLDAKGRVAKYIYDNEVNFSSTKKIVIADILNINPATISRVLRHFKRKNIIDSDEKIINKSLLMEYFEK
ncbi:MAG: hypothetical protein COB99_07070, partial [Sulfurimonas sp.]